MRAFQGARGLLVAIVLLGTGASGCHTRPEPPPPPELVDRVQDKMAASLDTFFGEPTSETRGPLAAVLARRAALHSWTDFLQAWRAEDALTRGFDPDAKVRGLLEDDVGWRNAARREYPPDGNVPDTILLTGVLNAMETWLGGND